MLSTSCTIYVQIGRQVKGTSEASYGFLEKWLRVKTQSLTTQSADGMRNATPLFHCLARFNETIDHPPIKDMVTFNSSTNEDKIGMPVYH